MPTVSELLTSIKDLSLVGMGDGTDDERIMRYFNAVYKEIYRNTAKNYPTALLTSMTVPIVNGVATLSAVPLDIKRIKDVQGDRFLTATTVLDLEERYPDLTTQGMPSWYYLTGSNVLNTFPLNNTTVLMRHIPMPATLTVDSSEADIKIPPVFHDLLLWGTLVYSAMDERDKAVGSEINLAQSKYEIALQDYQDWLFFTQTQGEQVTESVLGG